MTDPSKQTVSQEEKSIAELRRVGAYCTAKSYQHKALFEALKVRYSATLMKDIVHIEYGQMQHIFCFSYGVTVFWGLEESEEKRFLKKIRPFEVNPAEHLEREIMSFSFGLSPKIEEDEIILPDRDLFSFIAVSHGLAQSVKLATFENTIYSTIESTKNIPEQLATYGRIPLSKGEIRRKMGELFIERSSINLHSDVLDVPEFFWEHSEVEPLYIMIANHLDLETRIEILNQRLDVVHELFEMLGNELNHQHSSRLEWIIIWLIVIEVVISLMRDMFHLF